MQESVFHFNKNQTGRSIKITDSANLKMDTIKDGSFGPDAATAVAVTAATAAAATPSPQRGSALKKIGYLKIQKLRI